jgi:hypothetical protein
MSRVSLTGDPLGTGTFTIASPNSNTDRTLTLPNASGTLNISGAPNEVPAGTASAPALTTTGDTNTGIFFPAADTIAFAEGGAEVARFDASGNLLVGTTVAGSPGLGVSNSANISFPESTANTSFATMFRQASSADLVLGSGVRYSGTSNAFASSTGSAWARTAINVGYGAIKFFTAAEATVSVGTDTTMTERARIDSSGNLLVGTTSYGTGAVGFMADGSSISRGSCRSVLSSSINSNSTFEAYSTGAAAYRFYVGMGGTVFATNTTISAISDQRLKENIQDLDVGLDAVMALKPRKYDWKAGKGKDIKGDRGWIAQEFEQVFPDMVDQWLDPAPEGEEPYKSVRADLIPVLVKAIQELKADLDATKAELAALKGQA